MSDTNLRKTLTDRGWLISSEKHYACISLTPAFYEEMLSKVMERDIDPIILVQKHMKWLSEQPPETLFLQMGQIDYEEAEILETVAEFNYEQSH